MQDSIISILLGKPNCYIATDFKSASLNSIPLISSERLENKFALNRYIKFKTETFATSGSPHIKTNGHQYHNGLLKGWASVFRTYSSRLISSGSLKMR